MAALQHCAGFDRFGRAHAHPQQRVLMGTEGHSMTRVSSGDAFSSSYLRIRGYTALSSASNSSTSSACAEREFLPGSAQEETCIADRCEHSSHGIFKRSSATFAVKSCLWVALSHTAGYGCSTSAGGAMSTLSNWTMNVGESQTAEVPPGSSSMNWSREISAAITLAPAEVAPQPTGRGARPATASLEDEISVQDFSNSSNGKCEAGPSRRRTGPLLDRQGRNGCCDAQARWRRSSLGWLGFSV